MSKKNDYKWMVRVGCMTFNHASYIEDAMNGFAMQQTDFPFVCTIIDDASTDGEQEVIKNYLNEHFDLEDINIVRREETNEYLLIFARHKTNLNCYFAVIFLKYNHYSIKKPKLPYITEWNNNAKYIALCEGDDYWISPNKLQTQVDFMETHPDYGMCFHNAFILIDGNRSVTLFNNLGDGVLSDHDAIHNWFVPTASMLYKKELSDYPVWLAKIYSGDYALILRCLNHGPIYGFSKIMSIYRKNYVGTSATSRLSKNVLMYYEHHKILLESFNKGTNGKFNDEIQSRLKYLNREIKFYQAQKKHNLLKLMSDPFLLARKAKIKLKLLFK